MIIRKTKKIVTKKTPATFRSEGKTHSGYISLYRLTGNSEVACANTESIHRTLRIGYRYIHIAIGCGSAETTLQGFKERILLLLLSILYKYY
jgi:hypothetical protein